MTYDGRSFVPLLRGEKGNPREWIFVGCQGKSYVREDKWKLDGSGSLFDMKDAPFAEPLVSPKAENEDAKAARQRLRAVQTALKSTGWKSVPKVPAKTRPEKQREDQKQENKE